jgi:hypothetical protein
LWIEDPKPFGFEMFTRHGGRRRSNDGDEIASLRLNAKDGETGFGIVERDSFDGSFNAIGRGAASRCHLSLDEKW